MSDQERSLVEWKATRGGKSRAQEIWAAALARAGKRVLIVRPDGQTMILPFKRPD